jgi:hypothetical protein
MRYIRQIFFLVLFVALPAFAQADEPWERFVGTYLGLGHSATDASATRDLEVVVAAREGGKGFQVEWTALVSRRDGSIDRRSMAVDFIPGGRDGVFAAAMRKDMFGQAVPLDPLKGDPYVWSVIHGNTLIVQMLLILDDGAYQMQSYYRTLTPEGMRLVFNRTTDGKTITAIEADLIKAQ